MTTAREVMTAEPRIVNVSETASSIARILAEEDIGAVIVCNDDRRLQGVVSDRDLAVGVVGRGNDPDSITASQLVDGREVATIGADDSVEEAIETMKNHAVRRLPVIDGTDVVGMVSQADLAQKVSGDQVKDLLVAISTAEDNTGRG